MKDPFARLNTLISRNFPSGVSNPINLHIGDPKGTPNPKVVEYFRNNLDLGRYPPSATIPELTESIRSYKQRVHNVNLNSDQISAVQGTKSALAWIPSIFLGRNNRLSVPDLSYATYVVPAGRFNPEFYFYPVENKICPPLNPLDYMIINTPHNPTGRVLDRQALSHLAAKAQADNFILISDECYIDIYRGEKPTSLLEVDKSGEFKNLLVLNSLSKSFNLAGLRSGFLAGDAGLVKKFSQVYSTTGNTMSIPHQKASAIAWNDIDFIAQNRVTYNSAMEHFAGFAKLEMPRGAFYFFVQVPHDGETWAMDLLRFHNIKVMPGKYLDASESGRYDDYVRIPVAEKLDDKIIGAFKEMLRK